MPRVFTNLLNQTIYGVNFRFENGVNDSLSVRLEGLQRGTYVEVDGIEWGVVVGQMDNVTPNAGFMFGVLQVLRNEVFDPSFLYGTQAANQQKDVIYQDVIEPLEVFRCRNFAEPMKLNDAANYLIVMPPPRHPAQGNFPYDCALTVKGRVVHTLAPMGRR